MSRLVFGKIAHIGGIYWDLETPSGVQRETKPPIRLPRNSFSLLKSS